MFLAGVAATTCAACRDGKCPECGGEVEKSFEPSEFLVSPPDARLAVIGIRIIIVLAIWGILSKVAWILMAFDVVPPELQTPLYFLTAQPIFAAAGFSGSAPRRFFLPRGLDRLFARLS